MATMCEAALASAIGHRRVGSVVTAADQDLIESVETARS